MHRQLDAGCRGAGTGTDDNRNSSIDMLGGGCRRGPPLVVAERTVAASAAKQADTVDSVVDLEVERPAQCVLVDRLAVILRLSAKRLPHVDGVDGVLKGLFQDAAKAVSTDPANIAVPGRT
jgi:hypothetical protein